MTLKNYADEINIDFFSTPFDIESVDFLDEIGVDKYKISSFDVSNFQILRQIAKKENCNYVSRYGRN